MNKVRTPEVCAALAAHREKHGKSLRSDEFNKSVIKLVELVRETFVGKSCVVPLKIIYHPRATGAPGAFFFIERDKEVINAAVEILREEFKEAGWSVSVHAITLIWPFTTKIVVSVAAHQYINRPPKK
jgi:hypothetical protein